jgi:hypothetical protein
MHAVSLMCVATRPCLQDNVGLLRFILASLLMNLCVIFLLDADSFSEFVTMALNFELTVSILMFFFSICKSLSITQTQQHQCKHACQILELAAHLVPYMSREEHGRASNLAAVMLLGYLQPNSTPFRPSSLNNSGRDPNNDNTHQDLDGDVWNLDVSEIIENCTELYERRSSSSCNGERESMLLTQRQAFESLVTKGLRPFLTNRPCHPTRTALLQLCCMVISPTTAAASSSTCQLLNVCDRDRFTIVSTLAECLALDHSNVKAKTNADVDVVAQVYTCLKSFWREGYHPFRISFQALQAMNLAVVHTGYNLQTHFAWLLGILSSSTSTSHSPSALDIMMRNNDNERDAALLQIHHGKGKKQCPQCKCAYQQVGDMLRILLDQRLGGVILPPNLSKSSSSSVEQQTESGETHAQSRHTAANGATDVSVLEALETGKLIHGAVQTLIQEAQSLSEQGEMLSVVSCKLRALLPCFHPIARHLVVVLAEPVAVAKQERRMLRRARSKKRLVAASTEDTEYESGSDSSEDLDQEHLLRTQCKELEIKMWHTSLALLGYPSTVVIKATAQTMAQLISIVRSLRFDSNFRSVLQAVRALCLDSLRQTPKDNDKDGESDDSNEEEEEEMDQNKHQDENQNHATITFEELVNALQPVLSVAVASSPKCAMSLCDFVFALLEKQHPPSQQDQILTLSASSKEVCLRLLAMMAPSQPAMMRRQLTNNDGARWIFLESLFRTNSDEQGNQAVVALSNKARLHHLVILVASASLDYSNGNNNSEKANADTFTKKAIEWVQDKCCQGQDDEAYRHYDSWGLYLVARRAMEWGSFEVATSLWSTIPNQHVILPNNDCVTESTCMWFNSLEQISRAEALICREGVMGCPKAQALLTSARSGLRFIHPETSTCQTTNSRWSFSFQQTFLELRIETFELSVTCRGLCQEMLLGGSLNLFTREQTRSYLHQHTLPMCFFGMAKRYRQLLLRHGPLMCAQSRTVLRTLSARCEFLAKAAGKCFAEAVRELCFCVVHVLQNVQT